MGKIVPALYQPTRKVLLVGQAPGADGDLRPLTGTMGLRLAVLAGIMTARECGTCGGRGLVLGIHCPSCLGSKTVPKDNADDLIGEWFSRANVLDHYPGPDPKGKGHLFPIAQGRAAAAKMWPYLKDYRRVLFCGKAVFEVFRTCDQSGPDRRRRWRDVPPLTWFQEFPDVPRTEYAWMPHTSLVVQWWNSPSHAQAAADFLQDLLAWVQEEGSCAA